VYFGPDPWVLILSRTQPVGPHGSVGPWEPVDSVAAYLQELFLKQQRANPVPRIPANEPPGQLNLWWRDTVPYISGSTIQPRNRSDRTAVMGHQFLNDLRNQPASNCPVSNSS
jgi:hypothetical protein